MIEPIKVKEIPMLVQGIDRCREIMRLIQTNLGEIPDGSLSVVDVREDKDIPFDYLINFTIDLQTTKCLSYTESLFDYCERGFDDEVFCNLVFDGE
jgi:hypothetical protein